MMDGDRAAERHARAWLLLAGSLALHVLDEALTDFLAFYNPLVSRLRAELGWFPMPTFTFGIWIAGLIAAVVLLLGLTTAVRQGFPGTAAISWAFSVLMFLNGLGHLGGSVYFGRWLPGATSAPLLLVASVALARATRQRALGRAAPLTSNA
jgi:hypothetical protein